LKVKPADCYEHSIHYLNYKLQTMQAQASFKLVLYHIGMSQTIINSLIFRVNLLYLKEESSESACLTQTKFKICNKYTHI